MRKFSWKFGIAFTTFCIGVLIASIWLLPKQSKTESSELNSLPQPKVKPVAAQIPIVEQKRERFTVAGVETDEEVEQFWITFQKAVADDDRNKVASMATYPLAVRYYFDSLDRKNYRFIKNRATFLKVYDKVFDDALKNLIAKTSIDDIGARYDGILTSRGEIWIGVFCLDRKCEGAYEIKLRTIHANSVFIDRPEQAK